MIIITAVRRSHFAVLTTACSLEGHNVESHNFSKHPAALMLYEKKKKKKSCNLSMCKIEMRK